MAGLRKPKADPRDTLFPDSVLCVHRCPLLSWTTTSPGSCQTTTCRVERTEPTVLAEPGGSGESQGQSRPAQGLPPEEVKEILEQNQQELVCPEGGGAGE